MQCTSDTSSLSSAALADPDGTGDLIMPTEVLTLPWNRRFYDRLWTRLSSPGAAKNLYDSRARFQGRTPRSTSVPVTKSSSINSADRIVEPQRSLIQYLATSGNFRSGTSTRLFIDGVQEGSTYSDSNNYLNGANCPTLLNGYNGNYAIAGWMDDRASIQKALPAGRATATPDRYTLYISLLTPNVTVTSAYSYA
jgi:hypothetical protein